MNRQGIKGHPLNQAGPPTRTPPHQQSNPRVKSDYRLYVDTLHKMKKQTA